MNNLEPNNLSQPEIERYSDQIDGVDDRINEITKQFVSDLTDVLIQNNFTEAANDATIQEAANDEEYIWSFESNATIDLPEELKA